MSDIQRYEMGRHPYDRDISMIFDDYGNYVSYDDHEAEVARLRAEVETYRKDAERWQHARKLLSVDDIAERQRTIEEWNYLISEDECKRADEAIGAAMGASA